MSSFQRQLEQAARAVGTVIGAIIGFFFRIRALIRALEDAVDWYRAYVSDPSKKSILLTYLIGTLLAVLTVTPLAIIALPLVLAYYIREMGLILHSDRETTFLNDPWREDRPVFINLFSMTVDGLKVAVLPGLLAAVVFVVWYNSAGVIDTATDELAASLGLAFVPAVLVGLIGWVVFPAFLARYADTGRLGQTVAEPVAFVRSTVFSGQYLPQFALGSAAVGVAVLLVAAIYVFASPLLIVSIGLPVLFLASLQAVDHFALGYKRAVGARSTETETETVDLDDKYIVPFDGGEVATPDRDRSILALGETGSGKTEAIKLLAYQFANDPADPFVVFDYKEDYKRFFGSQPVADGGVATADDAADLDELEPDLDTDDPGDLIEVSLDGSSHVWNIFAEAADESDFEELGRTLFATQEQSASDPFFAVSARQAFVGVLKVINRDDAIENPTNADLVTYFEESDIEDIYNDLRAHKDLKGIAVNLDPETSRRMAGAVYGQVQTVISEVFRGDFRKEGQFSIREYMDDPRGRTLLLDFPSDRGETIKPIFRLMIDWSIRFGLADPSQDSYFILDEFATIPGLERLERLVNVGRARNAYAILGVQAKSQLHATYGRDEAESILSGLAQEVLLRPGDEASVNHIRNRLGRNQRIQLVQGPTSRITRLLTDRESEYNQYSVHEDYPMSEAELQQFQPGEAVVIEQEGWRHGRLLMLEDVRDVLDRVHDRGLEPDRPTPDGASDNERRRA